MVTSPAEAVELANALNNPLSVELELGEKYEVSPTLAKEKSISAAKLGAILSLPLWWCITLREVLSQFALKDFWYQY